jgi:hypothetical protein
MSLSTWRRSQALIGKYAKVTGDLMSGYRGIVQIIDTQVFSSGNIGIEAVKPNGGTCDLMRHEVRVFRDQAAAAQRFGQ